MNFTDEYPQPETLRPAVPTVMVQYCPGCKEDRMGDMVLAGDCAICGSSLVRITRAVSHAVVSDTEEGPFGQDSGILGGLFDGLLDIMGGSDLRSELVAAIRNQSIVKPISNDFLKTIGRVVIDPHGGLMIDVTLRIGPYKAMLIPSNFAPLPTVDAAIGATLCMASPECGDSELINKDDILGSIVIIKRGKVTFLEKAKRAQAAGAVAIIVTQTFDTWPFVMTDYDASAGVELHIPLLMLSKHDSEIILGLFSGCRAGKRLPGEIVAEKIDPLCSICHDEFAIDDAVLKLPCRHMYHEGCVTCWLLSHNTCPLCRHVMPVQHVAAETSTGRGLSAFDTSMSSQQPYFM